VKHRIVILIPYFGDWPEWMNFFIESCRANRSIDWILIGDADPPENRVANVSYVQTTFDQYKQLLSERLGTRVVADNPYKLCDIRPALPHVHSEIVSDYDFVGFGDIDVIYGDIRAFYDADVLDRYDLISSHPDRVSGHLCMMRNIPEMTRAYARARGWKQAVGRQEHFGFDERGLYNLFRGRGLLPSRRPKLNGLFREAYSTPAPTDHMRWYWKDGKLTNEFYPSRPFMYLHFMNWHSKRWYADQPGVSATATAPWMRLRQVVQMDWRSARTDGFMISPAGIQPIERTAYE
jgi:hypothetical protein